MDVEQARTMAIMEITVLKNDFLIEAGKLKTEIIDLLHQSRELALRIKEEKEHLREAYENMRRSTLSGQDQT